MLRHGSPVRFINPSCYANILAMYVGHRGTSCTYRTQISESCPSLLYGFSIPAVLVGQL